MYNGEEVKPICKYEAALFNQTLDEGKIESANDLMRDAIYSLKSYLESKYNKEINHCNINYQVFIVTLLEELKMEYRKIAFDQLLILTKEKKERFDLGNLLI